MNRLIIAAVAALIAVPAHADQFVRGYMRNNGTYVQPHMRSNPDGNSFNNWTTRGNVNPYTGSAGTRQPTYQPRSNFQPSYRSNSFGTRNDLSNGGQMRRLLGTGLY